MRPVIVILCALLAGRATDAAAGIGDWKTFTPKRDVRALLRVDDLLWGATGGGLFSFRAPDSTYASYATTEGLKTTDLTALAADSSGSLWIGSADGTLHNFRPSLGRWSYVSDIALLPAAQKRINGLAVWGDSLIVLSEVGVSVYSIPRGEFSDSYLRFGPPAGFLTGSVTSVVRFGGRTWVGTGGGIASTPASNPNPTEPSTWTVYRTTEGLPSNVVNALLVLGDTLYCATSAGLALLDGASWRTVDGSAGMNVVALTGLRGDCGGALYVTPGGAGVFAAGSGISPVDPIAGVLLSCVSDGGEYLGTSNGGALRYDPCPAPGTAGGVTGVLLPPGPYSESFSSIAVDDNGWLWAATGSRNGEGFMSFDGERWRSYTTASSPGLSDNDYYAVSTGPGNMKYLSSWGGGVALVNAENEIEGVLNTSNGLGPTLDDPAFVVAGAVATDRSGVTWIPTRTPPGDTTLVRLLPDGTLGYVTGCMYDLPPSGGTCITRSPIRVHTGVIIDDYGTKWFTNYNRFEPLNPIGFYYYNESRNLPGTRGGWGRLGTDNGLQSNFVWSLAIDRYGDLWVGSNQGITIIYNTLNPAASMAIYHPLSDQIIQDIVVDPMNRKWVATKQGVFLLSQDGTTILEKYTVENTGGKLLDNDVASLALDPATGTLYFGTEKGLSTLSTPSVSPARSFANLEVYPNPYEVPSPRAVTIGGLVADSYLKIFSVDGELVRSLATPGGGVGTWDGTDDDNRLVSSGVYVIVAYSQDGTEVGSGKIAVIRN